MCFAAGKEFFSKKTKQNDENPISKAEKIEGLEREKKIKKADETVSKKLISSEDAAGPTSFVFLKFLPPLALALGL